MYFARMTGGAHDGSVLTIHLFLQHWIRRK